MHLSKMLPISDSPKAKSCSIALICSAQVLWTLVNFKKLAQKTALCGQEKEGAYSVILLQCFFFSFERSCMFVSRRTQLQNARRFFLLFYHLVFVLHLFIFSWHARLGSVFSSYVSCLCFPSVLRALEEFLNFKIAKNVSLRFPAKRLRQKN